MFVLKIDVIETIRGEKGITLSNLAERSGKAVSTVAKALSRGRCHPATAAWLAKALGVKILDIAELEKK